MYKPKYLCDLHSHTKLSDGHDTPQEFIDRAAGFNMKVIAITDHDVIPPETITVDNEEVDIVEYAKNKGVRLFRGTEISCDTNIEDVHIVAFGCDWKDQRIIDLAQDVVKSKVEAYRELVDILNKSGMDLSWDEILYNKGNEIPEEEIQKKIIFQYIADKGYTETWAEAKMLTQSDPKYNVLRRKPDPHETIQLIHDIGGVAILAHPFLINPKDTSLDNYIEALIETGLDGIEACYTYDKTSYKGNKTNLELENEIIKKYGNRNLFISGGSDYHGDWRVGVKNPREIGEAGITYEAFKDSILYEI